MRLSRRDWEKTPYAQSEAKDPDRALSMLLEKYKVTERQWTEHKGAHDRPACALSFILGGKTYRITVETLDTYNVDREPLIRQVKRVIFWTLKPLMENAIVFGDDEGGNEGMQRLLLPFLVDNTGHTVYERILPHLKDVNAQALIGAARQMALPAPERK